MSAQPTPFPGTHPSNVVKAASVPARSEIGVSGLNQQGGYVYEEYLWKLRGRYGVRTFREMGDYSVISAILYAIDMYCRKVPWRPKPASNEAMALDAADLLQESMDGMRFSWEDTISDILSFLQYGWAYHEVLYERRDGRWMWRKIAGRSQMTLERWGFDDSGGITGMWQAPPNSAQTRFIPIDRSLLFRTVVRNNDPNGRSVIRGVYRDWYFATRLQNIESIGAERDLTGFPVVWVPKEILEANDADSIAALATWKKFVTRVKRDEDEGAVMPQAFDENGNRLYDFTLLSSPGRQRTDVGAMIERYDTRMAMSVLAQFIMQGVANRTGSFAKTKTDVATFKNALEAWLDVIAGTITQYEIPRLMAFNGYEQQHWPMLEHGEIEELDLGELGEYLERLGRAGILGSGSDLEEEVLRRAGISGRHTVEVGDDEEADDGGGAGGGGEGRDQPV